MKIQRATHLGMCFGVRDAIALATKQAGEKPLTILGELVHNDTVLATLRKKGIQFAGRAGEVDTEVVMITAHGASEKTIKSLRERNLDVVEATCPLVHFAHHSLAKLVRDGFHPIIIGKQEHVEVRGMTEDLFEYDVVFSETDIAKLKERARFGIVSQTTQPIEKVRHLVELIRQRFPQSEVRFTDTVCQPTKNRQTAAGDLAKQSDVVIVIGGAQSNNTRELVATSERFCPRVFHVQTADDLQMDWFANSGKVGITAGTSTPNQTIAVVEKRIQEFAATQQEKLFRPVSVF